jgi:hypothetical protein
MVKEMGDEILIHVRRARLLGMILASSTGTGKVIKGKVKLSL